jgi:hypothetical protein
MALSPVLGPLFLSKAYVLAALTVCPPAEARPQIEVTFGAAMTKYTEKYPSVRLKALMAKNKDSTLATDSRATVFGVTSSDVTDEMSFVFRTLTDRAGNQCIYIEKAAFHITYAPSVYVSSDILDLACSYQVTRAHEQTHVAIDYKVMQDYLPYIKRDMAKYLDNYAARGFGPYPRDSLPRYKAEIAQQTQIAAAPMIEKLRDARRAQQGSIDTKENYKRESDKCPQDHALIYKRFGGGRE